MRIFIRKIVIENKKYKKSWRSEFMWKLSILNIDLQKNIWLIVHLIGLKFEFDFNITKTLFRNEFSKTQITLSFGIE